MDIDRFDCIFMYHSSDLLNTLPAGYSGYSSARMQSYLTDLAWPKGLYIIVGTFNSYMYTRMPLNCSFRKGIPDSRKYFNAYKKMKWAYLDYNQYLERGQLIQSSVILRITVLCFVNNLCIYDEKCLIYYSNC